MLSGGSSKEFDSEETTGRFGTGFLVTHAVSSQVDVDGILTTEKGPELFHIKLVRDGDEDSIVNNIEQANDSLERAEGAPQAWLANHPTASFTYHNPDVKVVQGGLDRLEEALPYLYATCSRLGRVQIKVLGQTKSFEPEVSGTTIERNFEFIKTQINICTSNTSSSVTAVRVGEKDGQSALLAVLEHYGVNGLQFLVPGESFARVFVRFPIAGTDFLPFNVVLDGDFATFQERDGIAMNIADKESVSAALSALPILVQHAVESDWRDAHKLASLAIPTRALGGEADSGELQWWKGTLKQVANNTATKPLVQTNMGFLPALPSHKKEQFVSFPVPALDASALKNVDYTTFHEIVCHVSEFNLPSIDVAETWGEVARQWQHVGVEVVRLGLSELTDWLKKRGDLVSDLPIEGNSYTWLADLFLLAADMKDQNVRDMVNGLFPNQHGVMKDTTSDYLYRDSGIPTEVKDIASELGDDLRSLLLHDAMAQALVAPGYEEANQLARSLLDEIDGGEYTESKAIDLVLDKLAVVLPNNTEFDGNARRPALAASARMIVHLEKNEHTSRLRRCPLLTAAGRVAHLSGSQQILAPVLFWPETSQPYADLYADNRLLSDDYWNDDELAKALDTLIEVGLVISAPLFEGRRAELADANLLREMSQGKQDSVGAIVRDATFVQIAFLATDLVQRCGENSELAKLLLEFVLNVAVREDQSWRQMGSFSGTRSGERVFLTLNKAIWPFELKVRSWIPVKSPDADAIAPMPANESYLREILDSSWLKGNHDAVELLHRIFGFRQLTLMIDSAGTELEDDLVELLKRPELVSVAANNPDAVEFVSELKDTEINLDSMRDFVQDATEDESLLDYLAKRRKQRHRVHENQELGATVEKLVGEHLKDAGFHVRSTGVGSDFEIAAEMGHLANLHITRKEQSWLVEVKATREQRVRMTDTQARTAVEEGNRFLLCVVPLNLDDMSNDLADIHAKIRFVDGIGERLTDLCDDLGDFEEIRVDITADTTSGVQLEISPGPARFGISSSIWDDYGCSLDELAARLLS